jgi:hypothetical protein
MLVQPKLSKKDTNSTPAHGLPCSRSISCAANAVASSPRVVTALLIVALVCAAGAANALNLRSDLSKSEFESAGLSKLSASELNTLQTLIDTAPLPSGQEPADERHGRNEPADAPPRSGQAVSESSPNWTPPAAKPVTEAKVIETAVTDDFKGLFGATLITMANGQVWQQTDRATMQQRLRTKAVRIRPGLFGGWRVQFLDSNASFSVKRIR